MIVDNCACFAGKSVSPIHRAAKAEKELLVLAFLPLKELLVRLGITSAGM